MRTKLTNNVIEIQVDTLGAELVNLKKADESYEYMWQGDPVYWTGHSPVLFPIVGAVNNGEFRYRGKTYPLGNHGFARKSEFELIEETGEKLVYSLKSNDENRKMYPFEFELQLTYSLDGASVKIGYEVFNKGTEVMPFQIGTHPGFNCPMDEDTVLDDYYVKFNKKETSPRLFFDAANVVDSSIEDEAINSDRLDLNHELFYNGALVYENFASDTVILKSDKTSRQVKVVSENLPYFGLWQAKDAPYVCIEPWHGISDWDDFTGEFDEKVMMVKLETADSSKCSIKISVA